MKKVILSIAITAALALNAQGNSGTTTVSEDSKTGIRTSTAVGENHGNIGDKAVDLSYSDSASGTRGATGNHATALGLNTTASDYGSLVIGRYNNLGSNVTSGGSSNSYSANNTAFVIGNGTDDNNKSDAFTVMFNGDATLAGTLTAGSFAGNGSQLTGIGILTPVTEGEKTGYRLSTSNAANHGNIGSNAVDLSYSDTASGTRGATGDYATARGWETTASAYYSSASGYNTTASGDSSTTMGYHTKATQPGATARGWGTTASAYYSSASGVRTTASGHSSTTMGWETIASDFGSLVIGKHNNLGSSITDGGSAHSYNANNTAFVIGNGTDADNKSDAFAVMFDGNATLAGNLTVNSDARLKANIISLGGTLSKLLKIDGKKYTKKKDKNQKLNIGVLAQDIEKVFPELVSESNGIKSVNYQGLVPVLINALKEQDLKMKDQDSRMKDQDLKMKDQETKLNKQQEEINELKAIVKKLL